MDCSEIQPSLMDYSLGRLTQWENDLIRTHIAGCSQCKEMLEEECALCSRLGEVRQASPRNDVWALIRSRTHQRSSVFAFVKVRMVRVTALGAVMAVLAFVVISNHPAPVPSVDKESIRAVTAIVTTQQHEKNVDDPLGNSSDALAAAIEDGT